MFGANVLSASSVRRIDRLELQGLRSDALRQLLWPILLLGWVLALSTTRSTALETWLPPLLLLVGGLLAYGLVDRTYVVAAAVLIGSLAGALCAALRLYPGTPAIYAFPLFAFTTGVLLGGWASVASAALVALGLLLSSSLLSTGVPPATGLVVGALSLAAGVLAWVATRPLYTALAWSWNTHERAVETTEELRDHQGRLNRTLKDLSSAYERLEQINRELERARAAAAEAQRLKSEFAATISHELRTPLNLIIGFSEVMVMAPHTYDGQQLPPAYRGDVGAIYRNARHLSHLIDDILDLSQLDARRMALHKERLQLAEVIDEALNAVSPLLDNKGLVAHREVPPDLPSLHADRTRIRQVMINLLNNAARFTERGSVRVAVLQGDGEVLVRVADTGIGIGPDDLARVFEEFRQADSSTRRRYGGSGLGLAISKRFVELHGGSIWAESRPGEGSTFCFTLPLSENVAALTQRPDWETWARFAPDGRDRLVALVTDDPELTRVFERQLHGFRVVAVETAAGVRALAHTEALHAAVVVRSSGGEAGTAVAELTEIHPALPVVLCTVGRATGAPRGTEASAHLLKPILREKLLTVLQRIGPQARDIVVADDDPEMVRLLQRMLRSASRRYRVRPAYDGVETMAQLRARRPDVVLLDILMPNMDGRRVLEEMRSSEELKDVPVVVITAREGETEAVTAESLAFTRGEGIPLVELLGHLNSTLDALARPAAPDSPGGRPEAPAV